MLPDRNASVAVSRQWQHLEKLGLIERQQHGRFKRIIKRRECGLVGGKASVAYTVPTGAKSDVYFRVSFAYWREDWHRKLDMPGKAVLLAAMSRRIAARIGQADEMIGPSQAHFALLKRDVERFLTRPAAAYPQARQLAAPPGAPIGQPAPSWLDPALMGGDLPPLGSMLDSAFPANPVCSHSGG